MPCLLKIVLTLFKFVMSFLLKDELPNVPEILVTVNGAAKLLGHSYSIVTLKVYTQVLDSEIDRTGDQLRSYLKIAI